MTFREASLWAVSVLPDGTSPRGSAETIICHVMGWERHRLYLDHSETVPDEKLDVIRRLVRARAAGTPLQHLTGEADFMGRTFSAGPGALIPRPETEILVEQFVRILPQGNPLVLLDVGTGSGVIGISLALMRPDSMVMGTDISAAALELASTNRRLLGAAGFFPMGCDMAGCIREGTVHGIVANLPYVRTDEIPCLQTDVRDHDPVLALDGGPDGLDPVRRLLEYAPALLVVGGGLALELAPDQTGAVAGLLEAAGEWSDVEIVPDLAGRPRVVTALRA